MEEEEDGEKKNREGKKKVPACVKWKRKEKKKSGIREGSRKGMTVMEY